MKTHDCFLIQKDIDSMRDWCAANQMKMNVGKTSVISLTREANNL
jgi:hypothetical protein